MAELFSVQDAGIRVATLSGAKERFDDLNKEVFGSDIDTGIYTPQNQVAGINAQIWAEVGEQMQRTAIYGSDLNHAPGKFLDAFGSLFGIKRRIATRTRVECVLSGKDGVVVQQGSLIKNTRGDSFMSEETAVIQNGTATVSFIAVNPGPVPAGAGEVNEILTVTNPRWESVTNPYPGLIGADQESDAEYRANLKRLTALASTGTISALRSALQAAGASKVLILENSTNATAVQSGISLPPRSLFIVADGGLLTDLTRAYEAYRPVGVSTHALVAASKSWAVSDTSNVNLGAFRYNDTLFTGIDLTGDTNMSQLLSALNGVSNGPSFIASGDIPMLSYVWTPSLKGFDEAHGNQREDGVAEGLTLKKFIASPSATHIYIEFNDTIESFSSASLDFTRSGEDAPVATTVGSASIVGRSLRLTASPALPADLETITLSAIRVVASNIKNSGTPIYHDFTDIEGEIIDYPSASEAPVATVLSGVPIAGGVKIQARAIGSVNNWQYVRFDGVDYLDKDANGNMEWKDFNPLDSGTLNQTLTGFTNGREGSRVHIRPLNNTGGAGDEQSLVFTCHNTRPALQGNAIVDGSQIILTFDRELKASAETGTLGWWDITVGGSARNITKQITYQNKAFLTMASHVDHDDVVTIGYDASDVGSGKTGIIDLSGITSLDFTIPASNISNQTTNGLPSIPADFRAFKTGTDMVKAMWESNYNGGQTIDGYEYGISYDNGTTWSEWIALASGTREVELSPNTVSQLPNRIRARASNPNAQTLQKLGFTGLNALAPITRPVEHRLTVVVTLSQASQLVRDALNEIKTVLVNRVNQYSMGETIWVNDLLAVAELVQGARITNISVTHGGTDVNDVEQPAFVNWKLEAGDITFA